MEQCLVYQWMLILVAEQNRPEEGEGKSPKLGRKEKKTPEKKRHEFRKKELKVLTSSIYEGL